MDSKDQVPFWAKTGVGYQCFVDSFAIGPAGLDQKKTLYEKTIYQQPAYTLDWQAKDADYHLGRGFYGGDLAGLNYTVRNYLKDLGINLLYLTPIFQAESNHKYDTIDYWKIDPQIGTLEDFQQLVECCHQQDIKLILDGVFNHVSSNHPWHQEAIKGKEDFLNRFKRNKQGFIKHWEGVQTMPLLNHSHTEVKNYFYANKNNVINYWLNLGADGWRLDVAERLGKRVITNIRKSLKNKHDQALLIGEVVETFGREWLDDGLLDGVMNYVFRGITVDFLKNKIVSKDYLNGLSRMYNEYPRNKLYASWNIISTHDTNRMLFDVNSDESLFKMAVVLQFTYPGVPIIYYGDEVGMQSGQKGISNRMVMDWETVKLAKKHLAGFGDPMDWEKTKRYNSFYEFYKHMIWIRQNHPALEDGGFFPIEINDDSFAYFRIKDEQKILVIINKGYDQEIKIKIPHDIKIESWPMKCLYGQDDFLKISSRETSFFAHGKNSYIFVNG